MQLVGQYSVASACNGSVSSLLTKTFNIFFCINGLASESIMATVHSLYTYTKICMYSINLHVCSAHAAHKLSSTNVRFITHYVYARMYC
jgi:hypothetical protein